MAIHNQTYSDAQNRAMDRAMLELELSPAEACRRAAAGTLQDPGTGETLPAFTYNAGTAAVRKRRARRRSEARDRATLPAMAQLQGAAETLARVAHERAKRIERKHRASKLTDAELADAARALRETHRAIAPLLAGGSSSEPEPGAGEPSSSEPGDAELAQWAADAAQN